MRMAWPATWAAAPAAPVTMRAAYFAGRASSTGIELKPGVEGLSPERLWRLHTVERRGRWIWTAWSATCSRVVRRISFQLEAALLLVDHRLDVRGLALRQGQAGLPQLLQQGVGLLGRLGHVVVERRPRS